MASASRFALSAYLAARAVANGDATQQKQTPANQRRSAQMANPYVRRTNPACLACAVPLERAASTESAAPRARWLAIIK